MTAVVKYQISGYFGFIEIDCAKNDDDETVIAQAKKALKIKIGLPLPCGYESFKVVQRYES